MGTVEIEGAWIGRDGPPIKEALSGENAGRGANGGDHLAPFMALPEQAEETSILPKPLTPQAATGQDQYVEGFLRDVGQEGVGYELYTTSATYRARAQTRQGDLDIGTAQDIADDDGFHIFKALGKGNEDMGHGYVHRNSL